MFKHILVPTDGSELSQKAIRSAAILARENGARLTVFHARPELRVPFYDEYIRIDNDMWKECERLSNEEARRSYSVKSFCACSIRARSAGARVPGSVVAAETSRARRRARIPGS